MSVNLVYLVYSGVLYEGETTLSVHSREWFADYRAYREARRELIDTGELGRVYPSWDGDDWQASPHYSYYGVKEFEVTP